MPAVVDASEETKDQSFLNSSESSLSSALALGTLTGACAVTVGYPLDTIKVRLQVRFMPYMRSVRLNDSRHRRDNGLCLGIYIAASGPHLLPSHLHGP